MRVYMIAAVVLATACGGQTTNACVPMVSIDETTLQIGSTKSIPATIGTRSGNCSATDLKYQLEWASSNTPVLQVLSSTDSTATVKGLKTGTSYLQVWLRIHPTVRDSALVQVTALVDTTK